MSALAIHVDEEHLRAHDRQLVASWSAVAVVGALVSAGDFATQWALWDGRQLDVERLGLGPASHAIELPFLFALLVLQFAGLTAVVVGARMVVAAMRRLAASREPLDVVLEDDLVSVRHATRTIHDRVRVVEATAFPSFARLGVAERSGVVRFAVPLPASARERFLAHLRDEARVPVAARSSPAADFTRMILGRTTSATGLELFVRVLVLVITVALVGVPTIACGVGGPMAGVGALVVLVVLLAVARRTARAGAEQRTDDAT